MSSFSQDLYRPALSLSLFSLRERFLMGGLVRHRFFQEAFFPALSVMNDLTLKELFFVSRVR